jgi:hypothetical protein
LLQNFRQNLQKDTIKNCREKVICTHAEVTLVWDFLESVLVDDSLEEALVVPLVKELVAGVRPHLLGCLEQFVLPLSLLAHDLLLIRLLLQHFTFAQAERLRQAIRVLFYIKFSK